MDEFLPQLRRSRVRQMAVSQRNTPSEHQEVWFRIDFDSEHGAYVSTVDAQGKVIAPDYHLYSGEEFNMLRSLANLREEQQMEIGWGAESEKRCYLADYPYLLYQLLRCPHIVDGDMRPVAVSDEMQEVTLSLVRTSDGKLYPVFLVKGCIFRLLSDVFVLASHHEADDTTTPVIYPIRSLGENADKLDFFGSGFPEAMADKYLSVFYSYLENVRLDYDHLQLEYDTRTLSTLPTLVFEKVDADQALYLRVLQGVPGLDFDFVRQFDLLYLAQVQPDEGRVLLRRIEGQSVEASIAALRSQIQHYAPTRQAAREVFCEDGFFIIPEETAQPFLLGYLPMLVRDFQLVGADRLVGYKVRPVTPKLRVDGVGSGIDFLEGTATVDLGGESFTLSQFLQQYRKQKYVLLNDGNRAIIDEGYVRRLERIFEQGRRKGTFRVSFFDLPEVEAMLQERVEGAIFEHHRHVYEGFNQLSSQRMTFDQVQAELRPYQQEGVKWINYLYENNLGGCLADDMGLGKTLQTITMLTRIYGPSTSKRGRKTQPQPTLIVMPRSLLFNWSNELHRFAPQLQAYTYYGAARNLQEAMRHQVILTTYAMVRGDIESLQHQTFEYVVLDESQNIKNVSAQTTQAVMLLDAKHRLALSGTPIENNLIELYSLFRFLNPAMFGTLEDFNQRYTYPIQRGGDKEVMAALRRKIFPFMLRRLKKDVLSELPERIDQTLYVEMEYDHAAIYERRRQYFSQLVKEQIAAEGIEKAQFVMFQALNELRRLASVPESVTDGMVASPKVALLLDQLSDAVSNGHKVVVFFNYIAGLEIVGERLTELGIDFATITGATRDRQSQVEWFQTDPTCRAMLMTLKTGGVGLNLTAADMVYIFEPWWNKAAEEQAINRLHRFGQKANVLSYSLITNGTIEEKIQLLQQQKAELFEGLIGADASSTKKLSEEDIRFILG